MDDNSGWTLVTNKNKNKNKNRKKSISQPNINYTDDWNNHTVLKKRFTKMPKQTALRRGLTTSVRKSNYNGTRFRKIDEEDTNFTHSRLSKEFQNKLIRARILKKMTQVELANAINIRKKLLVGYENGTVIPKQEIITRLKEVLDIKLPKIINRNEK